MRVFLAALNPMLRPVAVALLITCDAERYS
jgi:hypothetical protein